jgi:hypothetical protein
MQPKRRPVGYFSLSAIHRMLIGRAFPFLLALFIFFIMVSGDKQLSARAVFINQSF